MKECHIDSCGHLLTLKIKFQVKAKTSSTAMKAFPAFIWLVFPKCWHHKHHILIKTVDAITLLIFAEADAGQSISGWQNENWACNDFFHPRWWTKIMILSPKKAANLCVFSKSSKWMTRWSETRELLRNVKNIFFSGGVQLNSSNKQLFSLFWFTEIWHWVQAKFRKDKFMQAKFCSHGSIKTKILRKENSKQQKFEDMRESFCTFNTSFYWGREWSTYTW